MPLEEEEEMAEVVKFFSIHSQNLIKPHTSDSPNNSFFFNMHHSCSFNNENLQNRDEGDVLDALQNKNSDTLDDEINEIITLE